MPNSKCVLYTSLERGISPPKSHIDSPECLPGMYWTACAGGIFKKAQIFVLKYVTGCVLHIPDRGGSQLNTNSRARLFCILVHHTWHADHIVIYYCIILEWQRINLRWNTLHVQHVLIIVLHVFDMLLVILISRPMSNCDRKHYIPNAQLKFNSSWSNFHGNTWTFTDILAYHCSKVHKSVTFWQRLSMTEE